MATSGRIVDYLGAGLASARPATLDLTAGSVGIYYATDTKALGLWQGTAWENFTGGSAAAVWGAITGNIADQTDLKTILDNINTALGNKVDKVTGKQLSTEDFTSAALLKLINIQDNATFNPSRISSAATVAEFLTYMWNTGPGYYRTEVGFDGIPPYAAGFFSKTSDTFTYISATHDGATLYIASGVFGDIAAGTWRKRRFGGAAILTVADLKDYLTQMYSNGTGVYRTNSSIAYQYMTCNFSRADDTFMAIIGDHTAGKITVITGTSADLPSSTWHAVDLPSGGGSYTPKPAFAVQIPEMKQTDGQYCRFRVPYAGQLNDAGFSGTLSTPPTTTRSLSVTRNGSYAGTISISNTGVFTTSLGPVNFVAGDIFRIDGDEDTAAKNLGLTFVFG